MKTEEKKTAEKKTKKKRTGPEASLTVEAAVVVSIVLMSIAALIIFDFRLHDKAAAENALICSVEMYSHRNRHAAWAEDYRTVAENMDIYITGDGQPVELKPGLLGDRITGTVCYREESRTLKNIHIPAEQLLRMATLTELTKKIGKNTKDSGKSKEDGSTAKNSTENKSTE